MSSIMGVNIAKAALAKKLPMAKYISSPSRPGRAARYLQP
jgi:hypothetical protein